MTVRLLALCLYMACLNGAEELMARPREATVTVPHPDGRNPQAFLSHYCASCHSGDEPSADLILERVPSGADASALNDRRGDWERVFEMLQTGQMPPEDAELPSMEQREEFLQWLEDQLSQSSCTETPQPGRVTIRRLNRAEYNNTIRDLVGVEFRPADDFPSDDVGEGFDNIADVLTMSPILLEKYLRAAEQIVDRVFEDAELKRQVMICPLAQEETEEAIACARRILKTFADRAYRRPAKEEEVSRLLRLAFAAVEAGADREEALKTAFKAVLCSPHFLFRVESDAQSGDEDGVIELSNYELASRMSYFIWSSMPDERLFELAAHGQLTEAGVLRGEVRRMLKDPKARALVDNFAGQWLQLRDLAGKSPDAALFPQFDQQLRIAMRQETEMLFEHIMSENRSILEFLTASYTFVNPRLARHYGIDGVEGKAFRRVPVPPGRRGVLTHGSVLLITSHPTRTSPVKRGKWILENLLDSPPPPPPDGVEELAEDGELLGSLRERMIQHRVNPTCASCHNRMDPLGFGMENFDAIGAWREQDGKFPIDSSGTMPDGSAFSGPVEMVRMLEDRQKDKFCRCLAKKMLTYALGRGLAAPDRCAVDRILEHVMDNEYQFAALVTAIVTSEPFRMRGS